MKNDILLKQLAEDEGFPSVHSMLNDATNDAIAAAICPECGYTCYMEPDCTDGWCEECGERNIQSCLILAELI